MTTELPWKTAWIVGASTGIGREVALQLQAAGVRVAASARSADKLAELGSGILAVPVDVTDRAALANAAGSIEAILGPLDLVLIASGTYKPVSADDLGGDDFARMMEVNYLGVINALGCLVPRMKGRGGQIAWIASVAGYSGLPKAAAYGPTKAALINLAESLKPELEAEGIRISVVNPGFVATPLTAQNDFPMPFLMQPDEAARLTIRGLARGQFEVSYPRPFVAIMKFLRFLPYGLYFRLIRRYVLKR